MKTKILGLILPLFVTVVAFSFVDSPQMGTWKLNEAKSKIPAGSPRHRTVIYEASGDMIKVTVDGVDGSGNAVHNEWTGKFDGKDYPVTGDPAFDTRSYTTVDSRTMMMTQKKDGKVVMTAKIVVAADGQTRTVTTSRTDEKGKKVTAVAVYDKQ